MRKFAAAFSVLILNLFYFGDFMIKIIDGIETDVRVKKVKRISIKVKSDGKVILNVPLNRSISDAERFFISKKQWIEKHLEKCKEKEVYEIKHGCPIYFFGKKVIVNEVYGNENKAFFSGDNLVVISDGRRKPAQIAEKFLTDELKKVLDETFKKWTKITGLYPSSVSIRKTTSRWGSCTTNTKRIRMSFYLVSLPVFCADYVTLHEILHIKYPNHGKGFHSALDKLMPEWKKIRKYMREYGNAMRISK